MKQEPKKIDLGLKEAYEELFMTQEQRDDKRREKESASSIIEVPRLDHPDTYIVQDGDTLYKLAIRFYGRSSAWSRIREANKAIISTDGRIRVGQRLVLPK